MQLKTLSNNLVVTLKRNAYCLTRLQLFFLVSLPSLNFLNLLIPLLSCLLFSKCIYLLGSFPGGSVVKNPPANTGDGPEDSRRMKWQPTSVFLPGKSHGEQSLVGYHPWGRKKTQTQFRD